jgi:hypothetical protein
MHDSPGVVLENPAHRRGQFVTELLGQRIAVIRIGQPDPADTTGDRAANQGAGLRISHAHS